MAFFRNDWRVAAAVFLPGSLGLLGCGSDDEASPGPPASTVGGQGGAMATGGQGGTSGSGGTAGTAGGGTGGSGGTGTGGTATGGSSGTAGTAGTGGSGGTAGSGGATGHQFSIVFDTSLEPTGWFNTPAVQTGLAAGAAYWARRIRDDFEEIPSGTPIQVRNLANVDDTYIEMVTTTPIDDLRIYVACSSVLDGLGVLARTRRVAVFPPTHGAQFQERLRSRWTGADQEPWVVGIAFGCQSNFFFDTTPDTADDIPRNQSDFITLVAHEVGHALGIGASQTYLALVSTAGTEFLGPKATALYGGPVPLEAGSGHLLSDLMFAGGPVLMDPTMTLGLRIGPTALEFAILSDIGYDVAP